MALAAVRDDLTEAGIWQALQDIASCWPGANVDEQVSAYVAALADPRACLPVVRAEQRA